MSDEIENDETAKPIVKAFSADVTVDEGERAVTAIISTNAVDRDGEVLIPMGLNSKEFEKNPVVFFNHAYADSFVDDLGAKLPVGKCVALKREDDRIVAKTVFASRPDNYPAEKEWLPDTLLSLYQQGVMNAFSVGFIPKVLRPASQKDLEKYGEECKRVYAKWNMFEYSVVPLGANQEAVTLAVSKGMIKPDVAKRLFGVEAKAAKLIEDGALTVNEARADLAIEPQPITPKRFVCREPKPDPKPAPDNTKAVESAVANLVTKARGRVYVV